MHRYPNIEHVHMAVNMLPAYSSRMMQATARWTRIGDDMLGNVYEKTDKGREEIATRKNRLAAKLRALLLLIDGQRALQTLANNFGPPELTEENAAILLQADLIALVAQAPAPVAPPPPPPPQVTLVVPASAAPLDTPPDRVNMHDIYSSRRRY